jgi:hypothetical protein
MPSSPVRSYVLRTSLQDGQANTARVYAIRFHHCILFHCHDILRLPPIWHNESSILSVDLRCNGSSLSHGIEGLWNCSQIDLRWGKPIRPSIDIHFCHCCNPLHHHTDELLQQGTKYLPTISVSTVPVQPALPNIYQCKPNILCHIHHCCPHSLLRSISRVPYHELHPDDTTSLRVLDNLSGGLHAQLSFERSRQLRV